MGIPEGGTVAIVNSRHLPGPHWEPLNDTAKAAAKKAGIDFDGDVALDRVALEIDTTQAVADPPQVQALKKATPAGDGTLDISGS